MLPIRPLLPLALTASRAAARATGVKVDVWRMGDRMYAEVASRLLPEDVREVEAAFWAAYNGH